MTQPQHTPTPWKVEADGFGVGTVSEYGHDQWKNLAKCADGNFGYGEANAAFIVHACNNVERLEKENEALKAQMEYTMAGLVSDQDDKRAINEAIERLRAALQLGGKS